MMQTPTEPIVNRLGPVDGLFETEVTLPVRIDHIVTKDLYCTLKLSSLDCSLCDTQIFTCGKEQIYA